MCNTELQTRSTGVFACKLPKSVQVPLLSLTHSGCCATSPHTISQDAADGIAATASASVSCHRQWGCTALLLCGICGRPLQPSQGRTAGEVGGISCWPLSWPPPSASAAGAGAAQTLSSIFLSLQGVCPEVCVASSAACRTRAKLKAGSSNMSVSILLMNSDRHQWCIHV